ncbi:MAG: hypothetical protein JG776_854 [Caloramator sp.]|jgi:hypothetical protein|uniref:hypothetical protein n=1 Tax=Caloramator sp. TaxID=1871330 RepID=UPI001DB27673|nr:hypothetical protein [Caloramator sp.]MBZ4663152.1 hypothetical protein [Caloramator sp.]
MFNESRETRTVKDGVYHLSLQIPEKEYFLVYDNVSENIASEILNHYLKIHQDDGEPQNININYNRNAHMINIEADLRYIGNAKKH